MVANNNKIKVYQTVEQGLADNFIDGFIGVNKTGKSSTEKLLAQIWRDTHQSTMQIYGYDYQNVFGSLIPRANHIVIHNNKNWALDCCQLRDCLLLLDEIKMGWKTPQHPPQGLDTLFSQCFYWNVSIIWSCHNPAQVPEVCTMHTTIYHLFLSYFKRRQFEMKIPNAWICIAAANQVKKYVKQYGRGHHKLDPNYRGQGFPYMIVDMQKQTTKAVNMNKPLI